MGQATCSVDSCPGGSRSIRGWCPTHYERWRQHGDPLTVRQRGKRAKPCAASGCDEKGSEGLGYCRAHYKRFKRYGDPEGVPPERETPTCKPCGDGTPAHARGLCGKHYARLVRLGTTDLARQQGTAATIAARLPVGGPIECWEWLGARHPYGHGQIQDRATRRVVYVHRVVWEIANGRALAPGEVVRHSCDNPPCANPGHLLVGTQMQNMQDMIDRGRAWWQKGASQAAG